MAIAAFGQLKSQGPGHRIGLGQPQRQPLADAVGFAGLLAHELPCRFVVAEVFAAEVASQHQSVTAKVLDRGEKAERLHPGDAAFDQLPDLVGEKGGDIAVDGVALSLHRAPL